MAIIDVFTRVSENQALTGGGVVGNFFSTNIIDLTATGVARQFRDVGRGNELALRIHVTEAFVAGGGGVTSLDTTIIVADSQDMLTNLVNLAKWSNITAALTLNAVFTLPLPTIPKHMLEPSLGPSGEPGRRYLGVLYTAIGGDFNYTAGKVTADFGHWRDTAQPSLHKIGYAGP